MSDLQVKQVEFVVGDSDPFDALFSLPHEAVLYIPSTVDVNVVDAELQAAMVAYVSEQLAKEFGGVTQNAPARGGWSSETLGMVYESVVPLTCYISDLTVTAKRYLVDLAKHIKVTMSQEAVLLVVDGKGYLV